MQFAFEKEESREQFEWIHRDTPFGMLYNIMKAKSTNNVPLLIWKSFVLMIVVVNDVGSNSELDDVDTEGA